MIATKKLPPHVRNYFEAFGYDESSFIPCEMCALKMGWKQVRAVEIHHVEPRSSFGSKRIEERDSAENCVAVCRECHMQAHGPNSREVKIILKEIIANRSNPID